MAFDFTPLSLQVWGDFAVFTRPELKVERVTYPVMTPSAARGVLESVFWKPEFVWQIHEIHVLRPIVYFSINRNEVNSRASERAAAKWEREGGGYVASADRSQRHTLALRDVAYRIIASPRLHPHATDNPAKYRDQFRRRVKKGQCYSTPYLGCREFAASFGEADNTPAISYSESIGNMLLDMDYATDGSGRGEPHFFQAEIVNGVLHVPDFESEV